MPDFSLRGGGGRHEEGGADTSDSKLTTVTGGAADTKGAYVQLIAASEFDTGFVEIAAISEAKIMFLLDIAVGAAASEQDVLGNILIPGFDIPPKIIIPIKIAAGSRISARVQDDVGTQSIDIGVRLFGFTFENAAPLNRFLAYGFNVSDTGGVNVDPGAVAHTKGAYSEIIASTTNPIRMLGMSFGNQENDARTESNNLLDVAVGAATSEQIIISDVYVRQDAQKDMFYPQFCGMWPVNIPEGSRLAVRAQSSITDAADRLFDAVLYGLD